MYTITLEGNQVKKNQVTGMHLMAGLLLIVMGLLTWLVPNAVKQAEFEFLNWVGLGYAFFGMVILAICIFLNKKIIQTRANFTLRVLEVASLAPILIYSIVQKWYLPAGYSAAALLGIILAFYWEKSGKQKRIASFDDSGVHIPRLGKNSDLPWQEITRVLLRHQILTVDCKNNKLFQFTVDSQQNTVNKDEFEGYCRIQVEAKKHLQTNEW